MNGIEWLEANGVPFVVRVGGEEYPLPDPRELDYQLILAVLEFEDPLSLVSNASLPEWKRRLICDRWRACWDLPEYEIAHHLVYLVDHFRAEIASDLLTIANVDLSQMWRQRRWQTLFDLISTMPQGSASSAALAMDKEHARMLAGQILDQQEGDDNTPALVGWTPVRGQLADIYDGILSVAHTLVAVNGGDVPKGDHSYPRPKTELERELERQKLERRKAKHSDLVARVLKR